MLRNRRTGEIFDSSGRKIEKSFPKSKSTLFQPNKESKSSSQRTLEHFDGSLNVDAVLKLVDSQLADQLSTTERKAILEICEKNKNSVSEILQEMITQFEKNKKPKTEPKKVDEEFLPFIMKQLLGAKLPIIGPIMLGLLSATPAAAESTDYVCTDGIPAGMSTTCPDASDYGCAQGYLSRNGQVLTQFNRVVTQIVTKDADLASREQLRKCMTTEKVCQLVQKVYDAGQSSIQIPASGQDAAWNGYQLTSKVTHLPLDTASSYDTVFKANALDCHSIIGQAKQTAIILGATAGAVVGLACCVGLFYYLRDKCKPDDRCDVACLKV